MRWRQIPTSSLRMNRFGPRRLHSSADTESAPRTTESVEADIPIHFARSSCRATRLRPDRSYVPRRDSGACACSGVVCPAANALHKEFDFSRSGNKGRHWTLEVLRKAETTSAINPPPGCRFRTRCPYAIAECHRIKPSLQEVKPNDWAACIRISPDQPDIEAVPSGWFSSHQAPDSGHV